MWILLAVVVAAAPVPPSQSLEDATRCAAHDGKASNQACQRACDAGYTDACYQLATRLTEGDHAKADAPRAIALFKSTCAKKHAHSCRMAGMMLVRGVGARADAKAGLALLDQACKLGDTTACDLRTEAAQPAPKAPIDPRE